jgi:tetratricopeptide (TPR) repeat protein
MAIGLEGGVLFSLTGEPERAEQVLRSTWDELGAVGETGFRSTAGGELAETLVELGRDAEAARVLAELDTVISPDDFEPQARTRWVRATMLSRQGRPDEAEQLAREAVALIDGTDYLGERGDAHRVLGDVLAEAGRREDAEVEWRQALGLYERKGNRIRASQMRDRLGSVHAA